MSLFCRFTRKGLEAQTHLLAMMFQDELFAQGEHEPSPAQFNCCTGPCTESCTESETSDETSDAAQTGASNIRTGRKRRRRTIITADQLMKMEQLYNLEQWPAREKKEALAREIGMSSHFVNIWFQNKRSRMKKLAQEEEELEIIRKTKSPASTPKKPSLAVGSKPVAIAPKPASTNFASSPLSAIAVPHQLSNIQLGQCLVVGQNIGISSSSSSNSSACLAMPTSGFPSVPTLQLSSGTMLTVQSDPSEIKHPSNIQRVPSHQQPSSLPQPQQLPVYQEPSLPISKLRQSTNPRLNFFKSLVLMMAVKEGGFVTKDDPDYDVAVNSALYGLRITDGNILTYQKKKGLFIHNDGSRVSTKHL